MKRDDSLWKGILEDLIVYFLHFFFEEADQLLNMNQKIEFLDKEMSQISRIGELEHPKFVDKLVKVFTKEGEEKWVLIHIEIVRLVSRLFNCFTLQKRVAEPVFL